MPSWKKVLKTMNAFVFGFIYTFYFPMFISNSLLKLKKCSILNEENAKMKQKLHYPSLMAGKPLRAP